MAMTISSRNSDIARIWTAAGGKSLRAPQEVEDADARAFRLALKAFRRPRLQSDPGEARDTSSSAIFRHPSAGS